jgi:hypothetical protein
MEQSEDGCPMVAPADAGADREVVYDIELHRRLPDALRSQFPAITVRTAGTQTALRRQVRETGQLDALLQKLRSVGVVLIGIHRLSPVAGDRAEVETESSSGPLAGQDAEPPGGATYEVRVAGELGESLLRYLRWPHYVVPEQTQVRLTAGPAELNRFLRACTDCGASIDRIRRVEIAPKKEPARRELSDA